MQQLQSSNNAILSANIVDNEGGERISEGKAVTAGALYLGLERLADA